MTRLTRWDVAVFFRAAAAAALALALAGLVTAATDEGGVAWAERAGRTLPVTPVCAAIGAWGALAQVRARGEGLALQALGRSPVQIAAASVAGAALVAVAAAALIVVVPSVSVSGFFPVAAARSGAWQWDGSGFVDMVRGLRVGADGAPVRLGLDRIEPLVPAGLPVHARAAAAGVTALAGLALPAMLAQALFAGGPRRGAGVRAGAAAGGAIGASVVLCQAAAAGHVPALAAIAPPAALLAAVAYRLGVA
jgi:hypothetical protein